MVGLSEGKGRTCAVGGDSAFPTGEICRIGLAGAGDLPTGTVGASEGICGTDL